MMEGLGCNGLGLFNLILKNMKVVFNVELTPEGHTMEFITENRPLLENGNTDTVKYKKMLLLVKNAADSVATAII